MVWTNDPACSISHHVIHLASMQRAWVDGSSDILKNCGQDVEGRRKMPYIFTGDIDYEKTLEGWAGEPRGGVNYLCQAPWTAAHNVEEQVIIFPKVLRNNSAFDKSTRKKVVPEKASHKKPNRICKGFEMLRVLCLGIQLEDGQ